MMLALVKVVAMCAFVQAQLLLSLISRHISTQDSQRASPGSTTSSCLLAPDCGQPSTEIYDHPYGIQKVKERTS